MPKFLALDYGTKRIGIAITDELAMIASPLETIHPDILTEYLSNKIKNEKVTGIVLGLPKGLKGEDTNSTKQVLDLKKHLERTFPLVTIHLQDERYTSKLASRTMVEGNLPKAKRRDKAMLDKISAAIILQAFLENRAH